MLTVIADALRTATRNEDWDAPRHWKGARRGPYSQRNEEKAETIRKSLHYRSFW